MCQAFNTTPDVALRLLSRRHRGWTLEVLEAGRAEQLIGQFNQSGQGDTGAREAMGKWSEGDRALFNSLMRAIADAKGEPDDTDNDGADGGVA